MDEVRRRFRPRVFKRTKRDRLRQSAEDAKGAHESPRSAESIVSPAAAQPPTASAAGFEAVRTAKRAAVLVVEDDADLRDALCALLEESGYAAASCGNGLEALEYLRKEPLPRLVLLDLLMPVMSGWEFREQQLQDPRLASIPVVVLSAHVKADLFGKSLGVGNYLAKPLHLDELMRLVAKYCEH